MTNKEFLELIQPYIYNNNYIDYEGIEFIKDFFEENSISFAYRIIGGPVYETFVFGYTINNKPELLILRYKQF